MTTGPSRPCADVHNTYTLTRSHHSLHNATHAFVSAHCLYHDYPPYLYLLLSPLVLTTHPPYSFQGLRSASPRPTHTFVRTYQEQGCYHPVKLDIVS